ncbi:hypothetical protein ABTN50_20000, partial [Acinetobacter baumannii]
LRPDIRPCHLRIFPSLPDKAMLEKKLMDIETTYILVGTKQKALYYAYNNENGKLIFTKITENISSDVNALLQKLAKENGPLSK